MIDHPVQIGVRVNFGPFEPVAAEGHYILYPKLHEPPAHLPHLVGPLHPQLKLMAATPPRHDLAVVAHVHDGVSRAFLRLTGQIGDLVVAVEMDVIRLAADRATVEELLGNVRITGSSEQRRKHVDVRNDAVEDRAGLDLTRPTHEARHPPTTLPLGVL